MTVNRSSAPSELRITDMKLTKVDLPPWGCWILRLDTNQGISGFGELRDGASATYAKMLKARLLGENPCDTERLIKKIKQFGGQSRQAAGVSAVEIALWDLAGKAYGVPVYQLLGGKYRDKVRLYGDMHIERGRFSGVLEDPEIVGKKLLDYVDKGFNVVKLLSVELITSAPGNCAGPADWLNTVRKAEADARKASASGDRAEMSRVNGILYDFNRISHPFTNLHMTEKGLDELDEYIGRVRSVIGDEIPLAIDHFGHFPVVDCIKIAQRMEKYHPAWLEDLLPWYLTDQYKELKSHTVSSITTGEDMYLAKTFEPLLKAGALDLVHPDMLTCGGIMETKRLGDLAEEYGASMAVHMCESPVAAMAGAHMAMATENFFALEYDAFDSPWWEDLLVGPVHPFIEGGYAHVTEAPGLGIEDINADLVREHGPFKGKDIWIGTDEWNGEKSLDRIWS